ncbi:MAG TPA: type II toxin-antitoxin system Phd/YefM family antitoxin [Chloroflexota bacterium]|jgi:prevent-host-death family protein|nr:type II toxin-antitoxin system Phd/YefM family antitoxin [Chloroflexota bacterium]
MVTKSIGVRELRDHASEVLKQVERTGQAVDITRRGRTIARLVPTSEDDRKAAWAQWWAEHQKLVDDIAADWQGGPADAVEMVREQRREL